MFDQAHMDRHFNDVERLQNLAFANGVAASPKKVYKAWAAYSEASAAGWLSLYDEMSINWSAIASDLKDSPKQIDAYEAFQQDLDRIVAIARHNGHDLDRVEAFAAWDRASRDRFQSWASLVGYDDDIWAQIQTALQSDA